MSVNEFDRIERIDGRLEAGGVPLQDIKIELSRGKSPHEIVDSYEGDGYSEGEDGYDGDLTVEDVLQAEEHIEWTDYCT